jgi:hypothetical protein
MEPASQRTPQQKDLVLTTSPGEWLDDDSKQAARDFILVYVAEQGRAELARGNRKAGHVHREKRTILDELVADKEALKHFHTCVEYERDEYLVLYRELLALKDRVPHLVAMLPETRSLNDLCFWQQLGWILNERTYLGTLLSGFSEFAPEQQEQAAVKACEAIVRRIKETEMPFHDVMKEWRQIFEMIRIQMQDEQGSMTFGGTQHRRSA